MNNSLKLAAIVLAGALMVISAFIVLNRDAFLEDPGFFTIVSGVIALLVFGAMIVMFYLSRKGRF